VGAYWDVHLLCGCELFLFQAINFWLN
jgi:hypothetical protein